MDLPQRNFANRCQNPFFLSSAEMATPLKILECFLIGIFPAVNGLTIDAKHEVSSVLPIKWLALC